MKRILLALALLTSSAHASYVDGNELNRWGYALDRLHNGSTLPGDTGNAAAFHAYVWGVYDAYDRVLLCATDVQAGQIFAMVQQYLKAHPERWNESASGLVFAALQPAFPCKK